LKNARRSDIEYNGHDRNNPLDGPIVKRLKEYGRVRDKFYHCRQRVGVWRSTAGALFRATAS